MRAEWCCATGFFLGGGGVTLQKSVMECMPRKAVHTSIKSSREYCMFLVLGRSLGKEVGNICKPSIIWCQCSGPTNRLPHACPCVRRAAVLKRCSNSPPCQPASPIFPNPPFPIRLCSYVPNPIPAMLLATNMKPPQRVADPHGIPHKERNKTHQERKSNECAHNTVTTQLPHTTPQQLTLTHGQPCRKDSTQHQLYYIATNA